MRKSPKPPRKKAEVAKKTTPIVPKRSVTTVKAIGAKAPARRPTGVSRRAIFIDVENTSSEAALLGALDQLKIDPSAAQTEIVAVGNWRVIGQHVARTLAQRGARLLHTAPATGVKDWSDLWIAVAAGIWLGRAQPADQIDIVSADRAFDAVADAATHLGVRFRRLTYGPVSGLAEAIAPAEVAASGHRRRRRGGRSRRGEASGAWARPAATSHPTVTQLAAMPAASSAGSANGIEKDIQGASPEQIIATIARLTSRYPERGVNLDLLINALKAEGFGRPPGSPRLVTRLRKMKDIEVMPTGMVRLVNLPPGPLPESPAEEAADEAATARGSMPGGASRSKRPRRRGGRGRRRSKAAGSESANSAASESPPEA